jgi:citrate lyase subunit beta/citryl-CoA lyase
LFVPGDRPERFEKAWSTEADEVILDLEDAVGFERKDMARMSIAAWASVDKPVIVRINASDSEWYRCDLELLDHPGVRALMIPKAEALDEALVQACTRSRKALIPLIETAVGFENARALASTTNVERVALGTLDFQVDTGIAGSDDALLYFRSRLVLLSRLAGVQAPVDGVTVEVGNIELLESETLRSRRIGFGAKLCIHPSQVATVNRAFAPSEEEVEWATSVLQAIERANGSAVALGGKMIDRPVLLKAQKILSMQQNSERHRDR